MSGPFWMLLAAYVVVALAEAGLEVLNLLRLRARGGVVPTEFSGRIDPAHMRRVEDYTKATIRFGWVASAWNHVLILVFVFAGAIRPFGAWVAGLGAGPVASALVFFLLLGGAQMLLSVPLNLYRTFRLEQVHGFNTTTPRLWLADFAKGVLVTTLLVAALAGAGFALLQAFPRTWWIWVWVFFLLFSLVLTVVSPYVLEPLFNRFAPLASETLASALNDLMARAGIQVKRVFQMDASRRSRHSNAYFTGLGHVKRIVLFDTLLAKLRPPEILAVVAHEAGHWKKKHLLKRLLWTESAGLLVIYGSFRLLQSGRLAAWFHLDPAWIWAQVLILGVLLGVLSFPLAPIGHWLSRRHEREADLFAANLTGAPEDLRTALITLSTDNLSNLHPHPWYVAWHYAHPPILQRLRWLKEMAPDRTAA